MHGPGGGGLNFPSDWVSIPLAHELLFRSNGRAGEGLIMTHSLFFFLVIVSGVAVAFLSQLAKF